jgi:ribosomal protein S19E (S16A)
MATDSAPRRLWQIPTFLCGLAAVWVAWHYADRLRPSLAQRYEKALMVLRPAVDRWPPDADQVRAALRKLPDAEPPADLAPRAKYLTGSAYVALAESTTSKAEAEEYWALARRDLESIDDSSLPPPDQKKLRYRLARAWYYSPGADANRTIEALTKYASAGDDPSEGHRMLAELHLKSTPPNEPAARDALQNFLKHASPRADARMLNSARVKLAELHARLGEADDAKKVLERVGADAPPELYAAARLKLASFHGHQEDWTGAARIWEQVRDMNGATDDQRAEARVRLAEAYVKLGRTKDADAVVQAAGTDDTPENRAAWFRRAELTLREPGASKESAIANLERAYAGAVPDGLRKLVQPTDAQRVCQAVFQQAKSEGEFALAVRAAAVCAKAAPGAETQRMAAEAHEGWAQAAARDPARAEEAREHFRTAADAASAVGREAKDAVTRADWIRKSAALYLKAGDRPKALSLVAELTSRLNDYPEDKAGQAWFEIGEVYLAGGENKLARDAFQTAASKPGPFQDRANVRFADVSYQSDPDREGTAAVVTLRKLLSRTPPPDQTTREEALFLLGEIHLMRKEWAEAETTLKDALGLFPNSLRVARARYQYGQVLRHGAYDAARRIKSDRAEIEQIKAERLTSRQANLKQIEQARIEDRMDRSQKAYEELMRKAYDEFRKAEELLGAAPQAADPNVLRRTSFWAADCAYWLGEFADCAARCEKLAVRYQGKPEELEANRDLFRCCTFAAEAAREAKDTQGAASWSRRGADAFARLKQALEQIPATEFDGSAETRKRMYWEKWLADNSPRRE